MYIGFRKNINRATTQVMMKTGEGASSLRRSELSIERRLSYSINVGHVEKTNDRDYEVEERCGAIDDDEAVLHSTIRR